MTRANKVLKARGVSRKPAGGGKAPNKDDEKKKIIG